RSRRRGPRPRGDRGVPPLGADAPGGPRDPLAARVGGGAAPLGARAPSRRRVAADARRGRRGDAPARRAAPAPALRARRARHGTRRPGAPDARPPPKRLRARRRARDPGGRVKAPLLVRALRGERVERFPVWMLRQAGRYLPGYRAIREKTPFLDLCR